MENDASYIQQLRRDGERDADPRIDLAAERTALALERTQLAWIRTTLAFLGSGVALDKGMEAMHASRIESGTALIENAHIAGLSLSVGGTILMMYTTWHFLQRAKSLAIMKGDKPLLVPPGAMASLLVIVLGMAVCFLLWVS